MLKCKLMKYLFILLLFVAVVNPGYAQDAKWTSGNSLSVSFPMGTMADTGRFNPQVRKLWVKIIHKNL